MLCCAASSAADAITGVVWFDFTRGGGGKPGAIDPAEKGLPGMSVEAVSGTRVVARAKSDEHGVFTLHGLAAGSAYQVRLAASNFRPPYNGVSWLLKNKRELIDADLALNEGGWGEALGDTKISNDIQVSEKYVINFRLEVRNKGGHSSMPVPDNAIYHLAAALDRLSKFGFPLKTNEVTRAYFQAMSKIETGPVKDDLAKVAKGSRDAMQRVAPAAPESHPPLCSARERRRGGSRASVHQVAGARSATSAGPP